MGRYGFDQRPVIQDFDTGLSALGDALERRRQRERQAALDAEARRRDDITEKRQQASEDFTRRQSEVTERRAKASEERESRRFEQEQAGYRQKTAKEVQTEYNQGGRAAAEAYAKSGQYKDPITGEQRGLGFERGEAPQMDTAQLDEPSPGASLGKFLGKGPLSLGGLSYDQGEDPDAAAASGVSSLLRGPKMPEATSPGADAIGDNLATYRDKVQSGAGRDAIVLPDKTRVELDPQERERYQQDRRKASADRLRSMAETEPNPHTRQMLLTQAGLVEFGIGAGQAGAGVTNAAQSEDSWVHKDQQLDKTLSSAEERARIVASRPRAGSGGPTPHQKTQEDQALANSAHNLLNQELQREDYRELVTQARETSKMIDMLSSSNPAAHKMALGIWAKQASGPGAVQQSEREEFVRTVGGKDQSLRQMALNWLSSGEAPEAQRRIFLDAANNIIQRRQMATLGTLQDSVRDTYATHPNAGYHGYAEWAASRVAPTVLGPGRSAPADPDDERMRRAGY